MSGHSKWAQIKRQKGLADARRGQVFTKLAREISIAVRQGGSDPQSNARLRLAVQRARDSNMPLDNIERAIKRASGSTDAAALAELQALTDNRNRTVAEIRNVFSRNNSNLGESGCVGWIFEPKGVITIETEKVDPEELALTAIDAGADDVKVDGLTVEVHTQPHDLEAVRKTLEEQGISITSSELVQVPKNMVRLDDKSAIQSLRLVDKLEELDDVQHVYTNADFPEEVVEKYQG